MAYYHTNTVVVIFCEGATEEEFYKSLVAHIRKQWGGRLHCKIEYKNLEGIGNYKSKLQNYFENNICVKYIGYTIKAALCYDTDVFQAYRIKPVDWQIIDKKLRQLGADEVIHVRAEKSIEDWFLLDADGLRKYLGLPKKFKMIGYKGLTGLTKLFKAAGKEYEQGKRCKDLIKALNLSTITEELGCEIDSLISLLF